MVGLLLTSHRPPQPFYLLGTPYLFTSTTITFKNNFKPDFIFRRSDTIHSYLGREELDMILWTHPDTLGVRPEVSIYRCRSVTVLT